MQISELSRRLDGVGLAEVRWGTVAIISWLVSFTFLGLTVYSLLCSLVAVVSLGVQVLGSVAAGRMPTHDEMHRLNQLAFTGWLYAVIVFGIPCAIVSFLAETADRHRDTAQVTFFAREVESGLLARCDCGMFFLVGTQLSEVDRPTKCADCRLESEAGEIATLWQ